MDYWLNVLYGRLFRRVFFLTCGEGLLKVSAGPPSWRLIIHPDYRFRSMVWITRNTHTRSKTSPFQIILITQTNKNETFVSYCCLSDWQKALQNWVQPSSWCRCSLMRRTLDGLCWVIKVQGGPVFRWVREGHGALQWIAQPAALLYWWITVISLLPWAYRSRSPSSPRSRWLSRSLVSRSCTADSRHAPIRRCQAAESGLVRKYTLYPVKKTLSHFSNRLCYSETTSVKSSQTEQKKWVRFWHLDTKCFSWEAWHRMQAIKPTVGGITVLLKSDWFSPKQSTVTLPTSNFKSANLQWTKFWEVRNYREC